MPGDDDRLAAQRIGADRPRRREAVAGRDEHGHGSDAIRSERRSADANPDGAITASSRPSRRSRTLRPYRT
jgi:hypothetical protein